MLQSLQSALSDVVSALPMVLGFLLILIIGFIVAKVLTKILSKVLTKVGFDRAVERGGVKKALEQSQYDASDILAKVVFYTIMLFVLSTAFGVFGDNPVSDFLAAIVAYLPLVFVAIVIIVIASAIAAGARALIQNSLGGLSYGKVLANAAATLILSLGVIAALNQLQIAQNVVNAVLYASLAALVGIAIVAVGGGGIKTMSRRWEMAAARYDAEKPRMAEAVRNAPSVQEQARQGMDRTRHDGADATTRTAQPAHGAPVGTVGNTAGDTVGNDVPTHYTGPNRY